jgi:hypothetical protein
VKFHFIVKVLEVSHVVVLVGDVVVKEREMGRDRRMRSANMGTDLHITYAIAN